MKLKNIVLASAFVTGNLLAISSVNADTTFTMQWTGIGGSSASATGSMTLTDVSVFTTPSSGMGQTDFSLISGLTITVSNATSGNGTYTLSDFNGATLWTPFPLTLTTGTQLIGQTSGGITFGATDSSGGDVNFFSAFGGGGCTGSTPNGVWFFTLSADCGNADSMVLTSLIVGIYSTVNLVPNAYALRSVYNIQSAALNAGLSYDCNVFDKEGLCLSTGGRYSTTNSPSASSTSGLLIGSYKYDKNIRLGAWVDQNLSTNNADGVKLGNSKPLLGVFGVWSERDDGLGYEVKVSAGYGEKDLTVTRTSDYQGSTKVNMKGIQSVSSYGIAIDGDWIAAPYAGLKYVSISRGGYTEGGSSPLTYDTLRQETTSVLAGVKFTGKIDPQTFAVLSAGVEHDLNHNVGQYSAVNSSFSVTTTVFNQKPHRTRPVVSAGVYHDLDKTQRLGLNVVVRQEAFQSTSSTSAMATYTVGF